MVSNVPHFSYTMTLVQLIKFDLESPKSQYLPLRALQAIRNNTFNPNPHRTR